MVSVPTPADPSTGLQNDPRDTMRTLLQSPEPRTTYERKQIDDALARACMDVLSRMEDLEQRVNELEAGAPKKKRKKRSSLEVVGRAGPHASPEKPPASDPSGPDASGEREDGTRKTSQPGQSGGGSTYRPREGTVAAEVLQTIEEDGGEWRTAEVLDHLQRKGITAKIDMTVISAALGMLFRKALLRRRRVESGHGRSYAYRAAL